MRPGQPTRPFLLKTECPRCKGWVTLHYQTGAAEVLCSSCSEPMPVKDVHVSAGPFMIYRDVLTASIFKYKKLLAEAEAEVAALKEKDALTGGYGVSIRSLSLFITNLKELLDGCRFDPRHLLGAETEYTLGGRSLKGVLVNISVTGVCLDTGGNPGPARPGEEISVRLPGKVTDFFIPGRIMWTSRNGHIGVKFTHLDAETIEFLKGFIKITSDLTGI